jgi:hypothetical protein
MLISSPLPAPRLEFLLKNSAGSIKRASALAPPTGLRCGWPPLDQALFGEGLPCPGLSLWVAPPGLGATRLWIKTYEALREQNAWALWLETHTQLCPQQLWRQGVMSDFLFVIRQPLKNTSTLIPIYQTLKEALSFHLFSLIGVELSELNDLQNLARVTQPKFAKTFLSKLTKSNRNLLKLLTALNHLCKEHQCALVLMSNSLKDLKYSGFFDLVLEFDRSQIQIHRAKNRPSQSIPWSHPYGAFLSAPPPILTPRAG